MRLEVIEARDLEKKDIGFLKKGSADPFAVVKSKFVLTSGTIATHLRIFERDIQLQLFVQITL